MPRCRDDETTDEAFLYVNTSKQIARLDSTIVDGRYSRIVSCPHEIRDTSSTRTRTGTTTHSSVVPWSYEQTDHLREMMYSTVYYYIAERNWLTATIFEQMVVVDCCR